MTDWLDIEELDTPELTLPRVLDIPGALLRLGFVRTTDTRRNKFYRLLEPLFAGGLPATSSRPNGRRRASHVCIDASLMETRSSMHESGVPTEISLQIKCGYPYTKQRKLKLVVGFIPLLDVNYYLHVTFSRDVYLTTFERNIAALITNLKTKRLCTNVLHDSLEGLIKVSITPAEALNNALVNAIDNRVALQAESVYWALEAEPAPTHRERESTSFRGSSDRSGRLPNFNRRGSFRAGRK